MVLRPRLILTAAGLAVWLALGIPAAQAALGGDVTAISEEAASLAGTTTRVPLAHYDVHVVSAASGLRISEYVDRSGRIFAVSWTGPVVPDLRLLLGSQFEAFNAAQAAQAARPPRAALRVATPGLVVENDGHMRSFTGRAWVPAWLPAGVGEADVR
jgi:hypothetical protein